VIAAYVVVIALLWNLPYVRWVLWPFKVCTLLSLLSLLMQPAWAGHEKQTLMTDD
jgi:hypothetical protein